MRGDLFVVGGAERPARVEILRAFLAAAGGPAARIAIVPTSTADPAGALARMKSWFAEAGGDPARVEAVEASSVVPGWEGGAESPASVALVEGADGVWFPGGDQRLSMAMLTRADGSDTALLAAIRARHGAGAALGGTSAGAAIMSDPMIRGGTSFGALALPRAAPADEDADERRLSVGRGLGFFGGGIVDQHFDARARLARLLEAALVEDGARRPAFGVAEATAMVVRGVDGGIEALGRGGVYVVDPRPARRSLRGGRPAIEGAVLHYLVDGDRWPAGADRPDFPGKSPIEEPMFSTPDPVASGLLSGYSTLADFAGRMLLDNAPGGLRFDPERGLRYVRGWLLEEEGGSLLGWEIRLGRRDAGAAPAAGQARPAPGPSRAWAGERVSFEGVVVDILPVEVGMRALRDTE